MFEWTIDQTIERLEKLCQHGVLGTYQHIEGTEIYALIGGAPHNVFSIYVAQDEPLAPTDEEPELLAKSIKLTGLNDWTLGVYRFHVPISTFVERLRAYAISGAWELSGKRLSMGNLNPTPPEFLPSESFDNTPLNAVLKNNFGGGSYVLEFYDYEKTAFAALFDRSGGLQSLSDEIQKLIPIDAGTISDRIGNCVIQLPVTAVALNVHSHQYDGGFYVETAWKPDLPPRPLTASLEIFDDGVVSSFYSAIIESSHTELPMLQAKNSYFGRVWDDENKVLLAAFGRMNFIKIVEMRISVVGQPRTRTFSYTGKDGRTVNVSAFLHEKPTKVTVGQRVQENVWRTKRLHRGEAADRKRTREFVAYGSPDEPHKDFRSDALEDIRWLIRKHGTGGVWIWDPYLDAEDLFQTVYYCPHEDAEIRAISAGADKLKEPWLSNQKAMIESVSAAGVDIRIEFRRSEGWDFHDRFIIFPGTQGGAKAWSLGTSVNSLGNSFHILQQVADGVMMADTFNKL